MIFVVTKYVVIFTTKFFVTKFFAKVLLFFDMCKYFDKKMQLVYRLCLLLPKITRCVEMCGDVL